MFLGGCTMADEVKRAKTGWLGYFDAGVRYVYHTDIPNLVGKGGTDEEALGNLFMQLGIVVQDRDDYIPMGNNCEGIRQIIQRDMERTISNAVGIPTDKEPELANAG